jgi:hypothetical protein
MLSACLLHNGQLLSVLPAAGSHRWPAPAWSQSSSTMLSRVAPIGRSRSSGRGWIRLRVWRWRLRRLPIFWWTHFLDTDPKAGRWMRRSREEIERLAVEYEASGGGGERVLSESRFAQAKIGNPLHKAFLHRGFGRKRTRGGSASPAKRWCRERRGWWMRGVPSLAALRCEAETAGYATHPRI